MSKRLLAESAKTRKTVIDKRGVDALHTYTKRLIPILIVICIVGTVAWTLTKLPKPAIPVTTTRLPLTLPLDICRINGQAVMPEVDYLTYSRDTQLGIVITYVTTSGDLKTITDENDILAVIDGDFCRKDRLTYEQ